MIKDGFTVRHSTLRSFTKQHQMIKCIALCWRLAVQKLACCLGFFENNPSDVQDPDDVDTNVNLPLINGLSPCDSLNEIKMMGAIVNPLFQN